MSNLDGYQFKGCTKATYHAAKKIVPLLIDVFGLPESAVDLGGGGGGWLKAFQDLGTKRILCIDTPAITQNDLLISREKEFLPCDLSLNIPTPVKCDFAISTEFAEHVGIEMSEKIVDFLCQSAPVILFSAAIPGQGGGDHINEQRPSFWKKLYQDRGFERFDIIRQQIIFDKTIPSWFRQNLYLFVENNYLKEHNLKLTNSFIPDKFEIVHVNNLNKPLGFSDVLKELIPSFQRLINNRLIR